MGGVTPVTCRLRPVEPDDVPVFFEYQTDGAAAATAAVPSRDRADHEDHWVRLLADPTVLIRTVVTSDAETGEDVVAGNLLTFLRDGRREVGYWLGRAFWGRGLATAALGQFLAVVEERPLVAHVALANGPSATVLVRNGFREVGPHRTVDGVELREFMMP
jgi:RimJ/RimL family protein N-acetyltransferase